MSRSMLETGIFPPNILEKAIWTIKRAPHYFDPGKILKPRRLTLLASAAGLSIAMLLVGPAGYRPFNLPAFPVGHAAETTPESGRLRRPRCQGQTRRHFGSRQDR